MLSGAKVQRSFEPHARQRIDSGFTVAEMIAAVAIISILASMALPVISFGIRRQKEIDLRARLRKITEAVDRYHDLGHTPNPNSIKKPQDLVANNYRKDLEEWCQPIELNSGQSIRLL